MAARRSHCPKFVLLSSHPVPPRLIQDAIFTVMTGVVGIFIPFGRTMDLIYASGGCLIFSGYIVYDTYMINKRLSPDEYILGAISLYLEYVSPFILRIKIFELILCC